MVAASWVGAMATVEPRAVILVVALVAARAVAVESPASLQAHPEGTMAAEEMAVVVRLAAGGGGGGACR